MTHAKLPISAFIIAKNEADRLPRAIRSVRDWVDEVIVVDSGSIDDTVRLAEELGAKTVFHAWEGYGPQKIYAQGLCRNDWLLNLDADEEVTPDLANEIRAMFANGAPSHHAYAARMVFVLAFEDKPRRFARWVAQGRLFNKNFASFRDSIVHDDVVLNDGSEKKLLTHPIYHYSERSLGQDVEKMNFYTAMQAENMHRAGRDPGFLRMLFTPAFSFIKAYIFRGYFLQGTDGLIRARVYAFWRMMRLAKARERFKAETKAR
jgi:glycosyltransferase involved in cell wall biosynthesis